MKISVVICTHNNVALLPKAIDSLVQQSLPQSEYEILVVDNASTDGTKDLCNKYLHIPNYRYIYEPVIGLSHARNTGMREAKGKYIAYLDDDAIASSIWLEKLLLGFETADPRPVSVGGKINPIWEIPQPSWFPDYKKPYVTILDYGDKPLFLTFPKILYGANMAFVRDVLVEAGGFRTDIGRKKRKLIGGEDMEVFQKFAARNLPVYYLPEASVHHLVAKNRLTKEWMLKRHYWQGRSEVLLQPNRSVRESAHEIGEALKKIRRDIRDAYKFTKEDTRFGYQAMICQQCGRIIQLVLGQPSMSTNQINFMQRPPASEKRVSIVEEIAAKINVGILPLQIDRNKFFEYIETHQYKKIYPNYVPIIEKALEHYVSFELLKPKRDDVFIDIASQHSPVPEIVKNIYGCKIYRQDLVYPEGIKGDTIGGDAAKMPLPDGSVSIMTLHCSFEHFEGDADTRFIHEVERLLNKGGRVCILPLYLKPDYRIISDPSADRTGLVFDEGANIINQPNFGTRFGRHYSVDKLKERIFNHLGSLSATLYVLDNEKEIDQSCYLKFILLIEKK